MKKRGKVIKHHIKHKSKLTAFLLFKLILALVCVLVGLGIISLFSPYLGNWISFFFALVFAVVLYLLFVIKILPLFKFM